MKGFELLIGQVMIEFNQEADSNSAGLQELNINIEDAGGGPYLVLETQRWALESKDDMEKILNTANDFMQLVEDFNKGGFDKEDE